MNKPAKSLFRVIIATAGAFLAVVIPLMFSVAQTVSQDVVQGPLGQSIDSTLRASEAAGFHGVVLIARAGTPILLRGYGKAHETDNQRFVPSTIVQIGSNVKDFTKVAIFQLVESGRLSLQDSLGRIFDNVPGDKSSITINQLLNHTAGFPHAIGQDREYLGREEYLKRAWETPLRFIPGTSEDYSNTGYSVLAAIIERLTGQAYDRYVADNIFRRVGMSETGYLIPNFDRRRLAHGYQDGNDRGTMLDIQHDATGHGYNLRGNGGMLSTVADMLMFYHALNDSTLLSLPVNRGLVLAPENPSNLNQPVVLAGSDRVSVFLYARFPMHKIEIVIATNHAESPAMRMMDRLLPLVGVRGLGVDRQITVGQAQQDRAPSTSSTTATIPSTGQGRTVSAWFEAYNNGKKEVLRQFFEQHASTGPEAPPTEARVERTMQMRSNLGTLTVVAVRELNVGLEIDARTADGRSVTLTFEVDAVPPYRMRRLGVEVN